MIRQCRDDGAGILLVTHDLDQVFALADRVVVLRDGRVVADVSPLEVHRDDIVALMSGIEMDSMARRQLQRLRSLVDQLSDVEPAASLPLIVSAMAAALDQEMLCVHLLESPDGGRSGRCAAPPPSGCPAPLLEVNDRLELRRGRRRAPGWPPPRPRPSSWRTSPTHPAPERYRRAAARLGHPQRVGGADRRHPRGARHRVRASPRRSGRPEPAQLELAAALPRLRGVGHRARAPAVRGLPPQPRPGVAARRCSRPWPAPIGSWAGWARRCWR